MLRQNPDRQPQKISDKIASVGTQQAIPAAVAVEPLNPFFAWLEDDLARLEKRFAHYATPISRRRGLPKR